MSPETMDVNFKAFLIGRGILEEEYYKIDPTARLQLVIAYEKHRNNAGIDLVTIIVDHSKFCIIFWF